MPKKKQPQRMCIVCGEIKDKKLLRRIVNSPSGIHYDPTGRMNGRGAYICDQPECAVNLKKKRALDRAFSMKVGEEVYQEVIKELSE